MTPGSYPARRFCTGKEPVGRPESRGRANQTRPDHLPQADMKPAPFPDKLHQITWSNVVGAKTAASLALPGNWQAHDPSFHA